MRSCSVTSAVALGDPTGVHWPTWRLAARLPRNRLIMTEIHRKIWFQLKHGQRTSLREGGTWWDSVVAVPESVIYLEEWFLDG
ncbi:hypothetical protein BDV37DRAFT_169419 [Aspergillus pseudonomiae]|uniref:Uncharacterized protein n=1 Tax=Aspergillus pseudonomiae TaxID=1506151 RepID=A0A5N7D6H6_9EURO|nr:uncharacterized protein BDV37DRAFT_169419 [Aspergillus pseudonomiae]KAE8401757.1 hypothetical protein BDV37DRAFT_169419 [Aspergillus pseudonomiae]